MVRHPSVQSTHMRNAQCFGASVPKTKSSINQPQCESFKMGGNAAHFIIEKV